MNMRTAQIQRKTAETDITLSLTIEGTGKSEISTGNEHEYYAYPLHIGAVKACN